jgi:hypothetical protein
MTTAPPPARGGDGVVLARGCDKLGITAFDVGSRLRRVNYFRRRIDSRFLLPGRCRLPHPKLLPISGRAEGWPLNEPNTDL